MKSATAIALHQEKVLEFPGLHKSAPGGEGLGQVPQTSTNRFWGKDLPRKSSAERGWKGAFHLAPTIIHSGPGQQVLFFERILLFFSAEIYGGRGQWVEEEGLAEDS